jgi:hypothetical protein
MSSPCNGGTELQTSISRGFGSGTLYLMSIDHSFNHPPEPVLVASWGKASLNDDVIFQLNETVCYKR